MCGPCLIEMDSLFILGWFNHVEDKICGPHLTSFSLRTVSLEGEIVYIMVVVMMMNDQKNIDDDVIVKLIFLKRTVGESRASSKPMRNRSRTEYHDPCAASPCDDWPDNGVPLLWLVGWHHPEQIQPTTSQRHIINFYLLDHELSKPSHFGECQLLIIIWKCT